MAAIGGETPILKYGLEISAETPTGTSTTTPVEAGDIFKLTGAADADGNGYKLVAAATNDKPSTVILVMALVRSVQVEAIGVKILSGQAVQIRRLYYSTDGTPTVGHSIQVSTANVRQVMDLAFARGDGLILAVDTVGKMVEVLI
jgi:hypothetical protein